MEFNYFIEKTQRAVQSFLGESVSVTLNSVPKNNGIILEGLTIMERDKNIAPTIYLNRLWEAYENGVCYGDIIGQILEGYEKSRLENSIDMDFFLQYDRVKTRIVYKLVNYSKNRALIRNIPHIPYLDLAIVFYCMVINEKIGNAAILIQKSHSNIWEVTPEELYILAEDNTKRLLGWELQSMEEVLCELGQEEGACKDREEVNCERKELSTIDFEADSLMYVLSNRARMNGAACILYEDVLKNIADRLGGDLYILPSSVHEVILIRAQGQDDIGKLSDMVREVNVTQLAAEEILSDSLYYFSVALQNIVRLSSC